MEAVAPVAAAVAKQANHCTPPPRLPRTLILPVVMDMILLRTHIIPSTHMEVVAPVAAAVAVAKQARAEEIVTCVLPMATQSNRCYLRFTS